MAEKFDLRTRLGAGHFGEVWLAIDTTLNAERALKLVRPEKVVDCNNFFGEAQTLQQASHPNIVEVKEAGTMSDGRLYVAMEYLPKGSLDDEAKGAYVPLTRAKRIMVDLLRGLEWAHSKSIVHRDLKPGNILVGSAGEGKLSDFGLAVSLKAVDLPAHAKSYAYVAHLAPEVLRGGRYSIVSDIYAAGVTLYRLVNGDSFLPSADMSRIRSLIVDGKYPDRGRYREFIPRHLKMVINKAMEVDTTKRFVDAAAMRRALEQVEIRVNWQEQRIQNGVRWTAVAGRARKCYEVQRTQGRKGKWSVSASRGTSRTSLRRMGELCRSNLGQRDAESLTRRILQDFVIGKRK